MTERLNVGVFGVGALGQHHARVYAELESVNLVGVYDVDAARAREIAENNGTRAYPSMEALAADVEAASVVVPTHLHFETFNLLAAHNLHMLVEKPIAATSREAEAMVHAAHEKGLILQVGHIERFNPVMRFLESNLSRPRFIEVNRLAPYPPPREGAHPRGTEVSVVLDLMIHDLEIILHLVGAPVTAIHASGVPVLSPTEDIANARLRFENGCIANVTASRISQERVRKIRVFQADTYVSLDYMEQTGRLFRRTTSGIEAEDVPITKGEPLAAELASFADCVRSRHDPVVSGRHASDALDLAVEICRHIREEPS